MPSTTTKNSCSIIFWLIFFLEEEEIKNTRLQKLILYLKCPYLILYVYPKRFYMIYTFWTVLVRKFQLSFDKVREEIIFYLESHCLSLL